MTQELDDEVASPCVGVCRVERDLCVGCGRTLPEIAGWRQSNAAKKRAVVLAARNRLAIIEPQFLNPEPKT